MSLVVEVWEEERQKVSRTFEFRKMGPLCEVGSSKAVIQSRRFCRDMAANPFL